MSLSKSLELRLDPAAVMTRAAMSPDRWQERLLRSRSDRMLLLCARQSGKSTVSAAMAFHEAMFAERALILLLSPSLRQSQELFRKVNEMRAAVGVNLPVKEESALRFELRNGNRVVALPGTEETVRGFSGVTLLVVDEAARVPDALYFAIRPMLAVSGGRMVCLTTPFGKRGFFYEEWTGAADWERVRITAEQCPRISKEFLKEERDALGDWWFRQEYLCEFVDTNDQVFRSEDIERAFTDEVKPLFPEELGSEHEDPPGLADIPTLGLT